MKRNIQKISALLLTVLMIISSLPYTVFGENETSNSIMVHVSISQNGTFVNDKDGNTLANVSVSLTGQESYCINDVLKKAHELLNANGADSYSTVATEFGTSITKLWNNESGNFGYWLNGSMPMGLDTVVSENDRVEAFIYKNAYPDTESYTKFENTTENGSVNENIIFTLMQAGYDDNWNTVFAPCSDATITVDGAATEYKTDADGKATVAFQSAGTYTVSAVKKKILGDKTVPAIAAPVCTVTVTTPITVSFEAQKDGVFIFMPQNIEVKKGLAQKYGYTELKTTNGPTFFDALVAAHILKYGDAFNIDSAKSYLDISNHFITSAFGESAAATSFFVNGDFPKDSGGTGYCADEAILSEGDVTDYIFYQDTSFWSDYYACFDCRKKDVRCNEKFELTLNGFMAMSAYGDAELLPIDGTDEDTAITVNTVNDDGLLGEALTDENGEPLTVDKNGMICLSFNEPGIYYITANGFAYGSPIMAPLCVVNVEFSESVTDGSDMAVPDDGYTYNVGDTATALKVTNTGSGAYTFKWKYKKDLTSAASLNAGSSSIIKNQTFTPPTDADGIRYYYCEVTYKLDDKTYTYTTTPVMVKVIATSAALPEIQSTNGGTYIAGSEAATPLSIKAAVADNGTLSFQWYLKTNDGEYAKIQGATTQSYKPYSDIPCLQWYYCEVTNTFTSVSGETYTTSVNSNETQVIFKSVTEYGADWQGNGTKANPYLIENQAGILKLAEICNTSGISFAGKYFKLTNDITLPDEWVSIGTLKPDAASDGNGANTNPFSGNFYGDNHTVTIPENGSPLFGYVREATVSDLNIYGTKINGFGLIGNYSVDYGTDGKNNEATNPKFTVIIDNCKLKSGSSTLYSGFIGGYASGINTVIIKNSTIEENVTIGYTKEENNIGSFAGEFNGQIINCKSNADVYGVNFVGGICADKGQTIGACEIYDCIFDGSIEATGNYVGGILGAGYAGTGFGFSANVPWPTVQNCLSQGTVKGANYVGGIMGAEPGTLECLENGVGYIQNNLFIGSISATDENASIGGVIGFIKAINRYTVISNNYFAENCGTANGIGEIKIIETLSSNDSLGSGWNKVTLNGEKYGREDDPQGADKEKLTKVSTATELSNGTTVGLLNSGLNSSGDWTLSDDKIGFGGRKHILSVSSATLSAKSGVTQYVNGDDILDKTELTLLYSDGAIEKINGSKAFKQYTLSDELADKSIAASIVYNNHQIVFMMNVKAGGTESGTQGGGSANNSISVKFTLYGDDVHDESIEHTLKANNLKNWIPTTTVTVSKNATVMDVLSKVLNEKGYSWLNDDRKNASTGNYIQSITNSAGVTLAEFTNGPNSGWMYTLNGTNPLFSIHEQTLKIGDKIVFYYTDNYTKEQEAVKWSSTDSGSNTVKDTTVNNESISVKTTVKNNQASAIITESNIKTALENIKKTDKKTLVISPVISEKANGIDVTLPVTSVKRVADANFSLALETDKGSVTVGSETLKALKNQASAATLTINIAEKSKNDVKDVIPDISIVDATIVNITISSGDKKITAFDGNKLKLDIPVDKNQYTAGKKYNVIAISDDTGVDDLIGQCLDQSDKLYMSIETPHLSTFVITSKQAMSFNDVIGHWAEDSIRYMYNNEIMSGVSDTLFAPDDNLTRAMLVTILHRLEKEPKAEAASFVDVANDSWYNNAVGWANATGIVNGTSDEEFSPDLDITREQMATILYRYAQYKKYDLSVGKNTNILTYDDFADISEFALPALQYTVGSRIMTGTTDKTLNPKDAATRAETATVIMRIIEKIS